MDKLKGFVAIILAFVLLLGGAYILYGRLADRAEPDQLTVLTQPTPAPTQAPSHSEQILSQTNPAETTGAPPTQPQPPQTPDFTVYDADGNPVNLSDYFGKPIVLNFWASWCGPCQSEMPDFHEKYLELGEQVQFLMVNMTTGRETLEKAKAFVDSKGYTFPVFFDTASDAASAYYVSSLPTTYFIDREGNLIARATGAIDSETLQRGIDMIL